MDVSKDREPADMPGWELHLREQKDEAGRRLTEALALPWWRFRAKAEARREWNESCERVVRAIS